MPRKKKLERLRWLSGEVVAEAFEDMAGARREKSLEDMPTTAFADGRASRARRVSKEALREGRRRRRLVERGEADVQELLDYLVERYREALSFSCGQADVEEIHEFQKLEWLIEDVCERELETDIKEVR